MDGDFILQIHMNLDKKIHVLFNVKVNSAMNKEIKSWANLELFLLYFVISEIWNSQGWLKNKSSRISLRNAPILEVKFAISSRFQWLRNLKLCLRNPSLQSLRITQDLVEISSQFWSKKPSLDETRFLALGWKLLLKQYRALKCGNLSKLVWFDVRSAYHLFSIYFDYK